MAAYSSWPYSWLAPKLERSKSVPNSYLELEEEISVVVRAVPVPGREVELREWMKFVAEKSSNEDGCLFYELFGDPNGSDNLYFLGRWRNKSAIDAHNQTRHVKEFRDEQSKLTLELTVTSLSRFKETI